MRTREMCCAREVQCGNAVVCCKTRMRFRPLRDLHACAFTKDKGLLMARVRPLALLSYVDSLRAVQWVWLKGPRGSQLLPRI